MNWKVVDERLDELSQRPRFHSTVTAMRRLVGALRQESTFNDVQRGMSHGALRFGYPGTLPFVLVGWSEAEGFSVSVWASGEIRERRVVDESAVPAIVVQFLAEIRSAAFDG